MGRPQAISNTIALSKGIPPAMISVAPFSASQYCINPGWRRKASKKALDRIGFAARHFYSVQMFGFKIQKIYVISGDGALVNEKGEEQPLKAGDFALVNPDEKHQYRNKGEVPFKMICGVPKEFE